MELGIIKDGVPLVSKQYYEEHQIKNSAILRAGFLSGLNAFVEHTFSEEIEGFQMKNFKLMLTSRTIQNPNATKIIFYCIGDKELDLNIVKKVISKVLDEFVKKYGHLKQLSGDLSKYLEFQQSMDKILGDLIRKPDDRVRSVF
ncbi:MAG: hypothetical protein LUQ65_06270 [Candidatus Helarchaeota archaeon]|nr:hypothetical protein [Candidatus Helarchaeota archaeon]